MSVVRARLYCTDIKRILQSVLNDYKKIIEDN